MRLIPRHRHNRRKAPRISLSQAEITADLLYPAGARVPRNITSTAKRSSSR
jgi:hypothetical protein